MQPIYEYLIKSAALALLFMGSYYFFLRKETFYASNRIYLLMGMAVSLILPHITLTEIVFVEPQTHNFSSLAVSGSNGLVENGFEWAKLLIPLYLMGMIFFSFKLIKELRAIREIRKHSEEHLEEDIRHIKSKKRLAPFSLFKNIFYCPEQFSSDELHAIITHEKVHVRQYHSVDVLLMQIFCIVFWFNPFVWVYKKMVKQNLEFLADAAAVCQISDKKKYQYLMLKQAVGTNKLAITNPFYNSLIKKRIVMLHQNQSKKVNRLKFLIVLPFLAVFLLGFNTKTIYETENSISAFATADEKSIELIIDKSTTNEELEKMKNKLAEDGVDLSYRTVRNEQKEIIALKIHLQGSSEKGKTFNANFDVESEEPINPVLVSCDLEEGTASVGNHNPHKAKRHTMIRVSDKDEKIKEVEVIYKDGKRKVLINGNEATEDELHEIEVDVEEGTQINWESKDGKMKKILSKKVKKDGDSENVFIIKDSDDDHDVEVISNDGFFFIDTDGKEKPLFFIDGKKASEKDVKALSPDEIESIDVRKGDGATKKYGKKAKSGVVEITTKKKN